MLDFIMFFSLVLPMVALILNQYSLIKRIDKAEEYILELQEALGAKSDLDIFS